jgi:uncharacterized membrane protein YfcA
MTLVTGVLAFWTETPAAVLAWIAAVVFVAFFVRGYAGFGASMITVAGISLVLPPSVVVPAIFMLEILASVTLLPKVWRDVDWASIAPLVAGCLMATPIGIALLARLPEAPVRAVVSAVIVCAAIALWRGRGLKVAPGRGLAFGTGLASGFLNGLAGVGGPPAVLFYFSGPQAAHVGRASVIAYFLFTDLIGVGFAGVGGLVDPRVAGLFTLAIPPLLVGIWAGNRRFVETDPAAFRRVVLGLLMVLGVVGLVRAIVSN